MPAASFRASFCFSPACLPVWRSGGRPVFLPSWPPVGSGGEEQWAMKATIYGCFNFLFSSSSPKSLMLSLVPARLLDGWLAGWLATLLLLRSCTGRRSNVMIGASALLSSQPVSMIATQRHGPIDEGNAALVDHGNIVLLSNCI